jgi:hypothetical protein
MHKLTIVLCVAGLLGLIVTTPVVAADVSAMPGRQATLDARPLPYPRSERAAAVWNERACWSQCGSYCTWGMAACLEHDAQGRCLKFTDRCDRQCQRDCRSAGGPYLPDIFD